MRTSPDSDFTVFRQILKMTRYFFLITILLLCFLRVMVPEPSWDECRSQSQTLWASLRQIITDLSLDPDFASSVGTSSRAMRSAMLVMFMGVTGDAARDTLSRTAFALITAATLTMVSMLNKLAVRIRDGAAWQVSCFAEGEEELQELREAVPEVMQRIQEEFLGQLDEVEEERPSQKVEETYTFKALGLYAYNPLKV
ncbi:hypothetical protein AK812_SmicGene5093 [Symbiodinium microadriaticum]|uniref:Uncharacterized protein n=1 Tax=Symbiodinium microadriaticum TaxID=2951 RepID=A0A1Q9EUP0_SYMMI|nr:hypothetical protein AK812_SmicGene5093 [Symbiodinium microadriaticum]